MQRPNALMIPDGNNFVKVAASSHRCTLHSMHECRHAGSKFRISMQQRVSPVPTMLACPIECTRHVAPLPLSAVQTLHHVTGSCGLPFGLSSASWPMHDPWKSPSPCITACLLSWPVWNHRPRTTRHLCTSEHAPEMPKDCCCAGGSGNDMFFCVPCHLGQSMWCAGGPVHPQHPLCQS